MYSLFVKNIGYDVLNVFVEIFDNNFIFKVIFKFFIFNENIFKSYISFDYMVFLLDFNSYNFKVVIIWEEKNFFYNGYLVNEGKKMK